MVLHSVSRPFYRPRARSDPNAPSGATKHPPPPEYGVLNTEYADLMPLPSNA